MSAPHLPRGFPGFYAWAGLFGATIVSLVLGMVVTFHLANRQIKAERMAREQAQTAQRQQAEVGRLTACTVITAQDGVYRDTPPSTAAGRNAAKAWHDLAVQFRCTDN